MSNEMHIKSKIINNIISKGKKYTCEIILLKSMKELHFFSNKRYFNIIKLSIVLSISIFKIHRIKNTKINTISKLIKVFKNRIFLAIKCICYFLKINKFKHFYKKLSKKIFLDIQDKFLINKHQKNVLKKKTFYYYRW